MERAGTEFDRLMSWPPKNNWYHELELYVRAIKTNINWHLKSRKYQ